MELNEKVGVPNQ